MDTDEEIFEVRLMTCYDYIGRQFYDIDGAIEYAKHLALMDVWGYGIIIERVKEADNDTK